MPCGNGRDKGAFLLRSSAVRLSRLFICLHDVVVALVIDVESEDRVEPALGRRRRSWSGIAAVDCPPWFWFLLGWPMVLPLRESFSLRSTAIRCLLPRRVFGRRSSTMTACRFEVVTSWGCHFRGPTGSFAHNRDSRIVVEVEVGVPSSRC